MSIQIRIAIFLFAIFLLLLIISSLKKDKMPIKYSIIWFLTIILILLLSIVPSFLTFISEFFGFEALSSMITGIMLILLIIICMSLTIIVSNQNKKIINLIQEVSILKEKKNGK